MGDRFKLTKDPISSSQGHEIFLNIPLTSYSPFVKEYFSKFNLHRKEVGKWDSVFIKLLAKTTGYINHKLNSKNVHR